MHRKTWQTRLMIVLLGSLLTLVGGATLASAAAGTTWYVAPTGSDSNSCLLASEPCATPAAAITKAASGDTILVAVGVYTATGSEVVSVNKSLALEGGWNSTFSARTGLSTIDGEGARKGVVIGGGISVQLSRFLIENGTRTPLSPLTGGGVENHGNVVIDTSVIRSNNYGGIVNYGILTISNSTISGNTSTLSSTGGGVTSSWMGNPTTTIVNSTISGNTASEGGGIYIGMPIVGGATVSLHNATITDNHAYGGAGGGVYVYFNATLFLENSLVAQNTAYFGGSLWSYGTVIQDGFSQVDGYASLGPLQDNGGPTETHALQTGSPAIDAGNPTGCRDGNDALITTDQRGAPRPFGTSCDIGAYEFGASVDTTPPEITVPADITVNATGPAGANVTYTVTATDEDPANPTVTCTPPSGSVFPIGVTTVNCESTDAADNTATASFTVSVKGAGAQLADLANNVKGVGPGTSLADKVKAAQAALVSNDVPETCSILMAFINQVKAQSGKSIVPGTATSLIADATRIRAVLGC